MEYNLVTNLESCYYGISNLIYYSHIPTGVIAVLMGFFVFWKNKTLVGKLLLWISLFFSLWTFLSLVLWIHPNSMILMFAWSTMGIWDALIFSLSFYFVYAFINKKDIDNKYKLVWLLLIAPLVIFNIKNTDGFDLDNCEAIGGNPYLVYLFAFDVLFSVLTVGYGIYAYRKSRTDLKNPTLFLVIGISFFLLSFLITGFLASYLADQGYKYAFEIEQYGLFGMTFFMGMLAFMIVKFHAFNIKMMATQALVWAMIILTGSELFFANSVTNYILISITLIISIGFGWLLVQSVKREVQQREDMDVLAQKLATANDKLRQLDKAKTEFLSIASHQLRTPLTAVKGYTSMIIEGSYGEISVPVKETLEKVYSANEHLSSLVEDLLNVSRIEAGRMKYDMAPTQVEEITTELKNNFEMAAQKRGLFLDWKLPEYQLPQFEMDKNKIRECFSNLVDNALKYTKKGGVRVTLEALRDFGGQINGLRFAVADTGMGMTPEEIPNLFMKFARGEAGKKLEATGTGLGLFVVKSMVETHHGTITATSNGIGTGSTFIIELPIKQSA